GESGRAVAALLQGDATARGGWGRWGRGGGRGETPRAPGRSSRGGGAPGGAAGGGGNLGGLAPNPTASAGTVVPLDTLAKVTQVVGPQTVSHKGQLTAVTVSF